MESDKESRVNTCNESKEGANAVYPLVAATVGQWTSLPASHFRLTGADGDGGAFCTAIARPGGFSLSAVVMSLNWPLLLFSIVFHWPSSLQDPLLFSFAFCFTSSSLRQYWPIESGG